MPRPECRTIDRRRFLSRMGAGAAASLAAARPWSAAWGRSAEGKTVTLGSGAHRYEWVRGWGTLPVGMKYGSMHGGVVVDAQNHVYFSTDGDASIVVLDAQGRFVRSFGKEWRPDKAGDGTHDVQLHRDGGQEFLYLVSLFRHGFAKLTTTGEQVWVNGFPEASGIYKSKEEFKPTGITVLPGGDVYVTDGYGANYIHRYRATGEYVSSWGGKSTDACEPGKFDTPHKIIVDTRGGEPTVLVADRENHRLQWFSREGKHVRTLDGAEKDFLRRPSAFSIRGKAVAIADLKGRVTVLEGDTLAAQLGDSGNENKQATNEVPADQFVDGEFVAPHGVAFDADGNLYVSEWALTGRVVKLARRPA
jgi:hypothetical protein